MPAFGAAYRPNEGRPLRWNLPAGGEKGGAGGLLAVDRSERQAVQPAVIFESGVRRSTEGRRYAPGMRPTVILKAALTLDGQLAAADGTSQWISSPEARRDAHRLRASVDAVMVGAGTVRADDPLLTVRLDPEEMRGVSQPRPVIAAGRKPLPPQARLLGRDPVVLAPRPLDAPGLVVEAPDPAGRAVDLEAGLSRLAPLGVERILLEGGARLFRSFLDAGLIDRGVLYYGPLLAGGAGAPLFRGDWTTLEEAAPVRITSLQRLGRSIRVDIDLRI